MGQKTVFDWRLGLPIMHLASDIDGLRQLVSDDKDLVRHRMFDVGATALTVTAVLNVLDSEQLLPEDEHAIQSLTAGMQTISEVDAQALWLMQQMFDMLDQAAPPVPAAPSTTLLHYLLPVMQATVKDVFRCWQQRTHCEQHRLLRFHLHWYLHWCHL